MSAEAIGVRVGLLEKRDIDIERQVNTIRDTMMTRASGAEILSRIESIASSLTTRIENLAAQQSTALRPNYSLLVSIVGVAMVFLTMIGGFAYWPINTATSDLKQSISILSGSVVLQKQYDSDQAQYRVDKAKLQDYINITIQQQRYNADMAKIDERLNGLMPRAEFTSQHLDLERLIAQSETTNQLRFEAAVRRLTRLEDMALKTAAHN